MLAEDIARLMALIPLEENVTTTEPMVKGKNQLFRNSMNHYFFGRRYILIFYSIIHIGGAFQGVQDTISPFGYKRGEGTDAGKGEPEWIVGKERYKYDSVFETLSPIDGKITGTSKFSRNCSFSLINYNLSTFLLLRRCESRDGQVEIAEFSFRKNLETVGYR